MQKKKIAPKLPVFPREVQTKWLRPAIAVRPAIRRAVSGREERSEGDLETQVRMAPALPQVVGQLLDQPDGDAFHLRRLLEDDQGGDRLAVDVARLEDGEHLFGQQAHLPAA